MPPLTFEIVADERAFSSLEPQWRALFGRVSRRSYFQSFDWVRRAWEHIARVRGHTLFIVVGRRAGKVVLIWPLARHRKSLLRMAEWIGGEHAYLLDVLVEDAPEAGEWLEAAWRLVTKNFDFMWLNHMSDDTVVGTLIDRLDGVWKKVEEAPYVDWAAWRDWETYWQKRSKNLRKDSGRRRRRLEEQGNLEFGIVTAAAEIRESLDWMFEHKAAWMRSKGFRMDDGGIDTADTRNFFRAFAADASASGHLRLATLTLDGSILAGELGIAFEGTYVDIMGVYDLAWDRYAPGKLLQADLLRWTLENDCAIFDFMPYGESHKYLWAPKRAASNTYLIPCSLPGRVMVAWRRSSLGATVGALLRLRPADIPRILRKRLGRPA